jgi:hypothetical protein
MGVVITHLFPLPFHLLDCKTMGHQDHLLRIASTWMESPVLRAIVVRLGGAATAATAVAAALFLFRYLVLGG